MDLYWNWVCLVVIDMCSSVLYFCQWKIERWIHIRFASKFVILWFVLRISKNQQVNAHVEVDGEYGDETGPLLLRCVVSFICLDIWSSICTCTSKSRCGPRGLLFELGINDVQSKRLCELYVFPYTPSFSSPKSFFNPSIVGLLRFK